jgi:hypothetical protein
MKHCSTVKQYDPIRPRRRRYRTGDARTRSKTRGRAFLDPHQLLGSIRSGKGRPGRENHIFTHSSRGNNMTQFAIASGERAGGRQASAGSAGATVVVVLAGRCGV